MVEDFLGRVFDGSARPLLVHLVEDRRLSSDDLREIERMMEEGE
jgi:predicted transcriptional regulator